MKKIIGGHYQIVKELGSGGFGKTYIAEDIHLPDRPQCVVKLLQPMTFEGSQLVPLPKDHPTFHIAERLFNKEAQTLYKLGTHDRIPQLFGHFEEDRDFFLVQQFIEGTDLSQEISEQQLDEDRVIDLLIDILTPLTFVHQHRTIHRDLKPDNIIRRKSDRKLILIDFGAVKETISQTTIQDRQARTVAIGTPGYMPMEQGNGKPTLSSDVYAVGMIGIQALTGLHPTSIPNDPVTGEIQWQENIQVSSKLAVVLNKMIAEDFRQRYQSAKEALEAVTELQRESLPKTMESKQIETFVINNNASNKKHTANKFNWKLILLIVSAISILGIGYISLTGTVDLDKTDETPNKSEPAF